MMVSSSAIRMRIYPVCLSGVRFL